MDAAQSWPGRDLCAERAARSPERTAIIEANRGQQWSYAALDAIVDGVAARLAAVGPEGLTAEDRRPAEPARVGVLASNRMAFVALYHAIHRCGGTLVPLDGDRPASGLADRIDRAAVDLLVCEQASEPTARTIAGDRTVCSVDEPHADDVALLQPAGGEAAAAVDPSPLDGDHEALIVFTSGTTGEPKGVRLTLGNLVASALAAAIRLGTSESDRWLSCLSPSHTGGLAPISRAACYGSTLVLQQGFEAASVAEAIDRHTCTGVSLVPTQLRRVLDAGWEPPATLRTVLLGGAPASKELVETALSRDMPVATTYGLTETASQVATARPETVATAPETVGPPLLLTDVTVVVDGDPAPPGEPGEVVVAGPTVTPGYLDEDRTAAAVDEYGLHTGDRGYFDEAGRLVIEGRLDDAIQTGGELVRPARVRDSIREHPAVEDAAVVGISDDEWGERVVAMVTPADDGAPDGAAIRDHCTSALAPHEVPKDVALVDSLPRTASGTIDRETARDWLAERLDDGA